jgi:hypothetical protein
VCAWKPGGVNRKIGNFKFRLIGGKEFTPCSLNRDWLHLAGARGQPPGKPRMLLSDRPESLPERAWSMFLIPRQVLLDEEERWRLKDRSKR